MKEEFDCQYLDILSKSEINPLRMEQEAWQKLSPDLSRFLEGFDSFINNYNNESLDEVDIIRIQLYNEIWYALYQEWDKISASYKAKQIPIERSRCRCWREFLLGLD